MTTPYDELADEQGAADASQRPRIRRFSLPAIFRGAEPEPAASDPKEAGARASIAEFMRAHRAAYSAQTAVLATARILMVVALWVFVTQNTPAANWALLLLPVYLAAEVLEYVLLQRRADQAAKEVVL